VPARLRAAGVAALAARPTASGALAARLGDEFLVRVDPFVHAEPAGLGATYADDSVRLQVIDLVADAHRATPTVLDVAPPADETIPMVDALRAALDDLDQPWDSGPFAEPLRSLLTGHVAALEDALAAHAAMVDALVDPARLVITHGETHPRNVLVTPDGPVLIDWDTCRLGLPERDLRDLRATDDPSTRRYEQRTGTSVDPRAMAMYDLAWDLTDIALYVGLLRAEHHDDPNSAASWRNLAGTFPLRATY
jgi:spectinomycin phosphotransferase